MGCVVLVLRSCWSYSVAGIFRLAECEAGSVVGSPRGWFCVGTLRVCPVAVAGGELYVRYGSTCSGIFLIWRAYVNAVSSWRECTAGLTVWLMRSYVRV